MTDRPMTDRSLTDLRTDSAENPEFARILDPGRLRDLEVFPFDIAPDAREMEAIARLMDAQAIRKLRFAGTLTARPKGVWELAGTLGATVIQTCVVTLDPVTTRIDQPVRRLFVPMAPARGVELVIEADEDEEVEPLGSVIDLGLVAIEALALALPPYPRKEGAELPAIGTDAGAVVKPFAALAALRDKLGDGT